jgi:hypothetical protein
LDISQAFAIRELRETQAQKLIPTGKSTKSAVASVMAHASLKLVGRRMSHPLREYRSAKVHAPLSGGAPPSAFPSGSPRLKPEEFQIEKSPNTT